MNMWIFCYYRNVIRNINYINSIYTVILSLNINNIKINNVILNLNDINVNTH